MNKQELKKQVFTVPNILTYIRVLLIPLIIYFTVAKEHYVKIGEFSFPIIGLAILIFAASTDLVDGYIARRFNQVSDLGKMIDPVADKLMHVATILTLTIIGYSHWSFITLLFLKEALMVIGGIVISKYNLVIPANMMGKVASATISFAIIAAFFHPFFAKSGYYADWILIGIGLILTYIAFFYYLKNALVLYRKARQEHIDKSQKN